MSYQGQDPNQPPPYGSGYTPPSSGEPYGQYGQGQPGSYQQPGYQPPPYGQQQYGYQQPYGTPPVPSPLGPTSINMDPKVSAGLSYLLGLVGGIVFFVIEKQNRFVRFHAMQSILFQAALTVLFFVVFILQIILFATGSSALAVLGLLFTCLWVLLPLAATVVWIIAMVFAFQGKDFKIPLIGDYAQRFANPAM